jgi:UV excision repair protein RAD23
LGEEVNKAVDEMVNMGFPKEQCIAAMKAAFNNPERAIEYLLSVKI